ncbi:BtpA/SgcQ family protein [Collinsella aerofaciens]|uniref:BtpA/SgcQ family protein n=1 Tax=Collinsella aerofaciens TaxID=74426 RepID=UPI00232C578A|nr:BtpA/SgcQ family protein [Collinsella aerofaciens]MDB1867758.1 BtpA/SgcQ family protein [Collinsella aerofaciens]
MSFLTSMFKNEKPVIGMLHLRPLPGDPLYYPGGSVSQVVEAAKRDLEALQQGGVDGILITNELSMPYEQHVSPSTLASMGYVIGALSHDLSTPWGAGQFTMVMPQSSCALPSTRSSRAAIFAVPGPVISG